VYRNDGKMLQVDWKNRTRKEIIRKVLTVPQSSGTVHDLRFSQQWCWRLTYSCMIRRGECWTVTGVSADHSAFTFRWNVCPRKMTALLSFGTVSTV
jgi:hypothetical protein